MWRREWTPPPPVPVATVAEPLNITYLLNPQQEYKTYFLVGDADICPVEKVGVMKKMLASHSEVFRTLFIYKTSGEAGHIKDMFPATFKNLLRFVYGHDITPYLNFEDADDLLYAANKYMMSQLLNRVALRLIDLVNSGNILKLLENPACYRPVHLYCEISKILQLETNKVIFCDRFWECSPEVFAKVLEQDGLAYPEVRLWKIALRWAKQKAGVEKINDANRDSLRKLLDKPLRQIRFWTMDRRFFWDEVESTGILSKEEVAQIIRAYRSKLPPQINTLCSNLNRRKLVRDPRDLTVLQPMEYNVEIPILAFHQMVRECQTQIRTNDHYILLKKLLLYLGEYEIVRYKYWVQVETAGCKNKESTRLQGGGTSYENLLYINVSSDLQEVWLKPNTLYLLTVSCDKEMVSWTHAEASDGWTEHLSLATNYDTPIKAFAYGISDSRPTSHV